jgi:hypothetical protein
MSGILAVSGVGGPRPFLVARTLSIGTPGGEDPAISFTFANDGNLILSSTVGDVQTVVSTTREWAGGTILSTQAEQYEVRLTVTAGAIAPDSEFQVNNIWYNIGTLSPAFRTQFTCCGTDRSGTWRFQIRRASDQVVVTTADYTLSLTS